MQKVWNMILFVILSACVAIFTGCGGDDDDSSTSSSSSSWTVVYQDTGGGTGMVTQSPDGTQRKITGEFKANYTMESAYQWFLVGRVSFGEAVDSAGANLNALGTPTLTIQAGTTVYGLGGEVPGTLIIKRKAKISAAGTSTSPIVFTSAQANPSSGDWGGLVINGCAPINRTGGEALGEGSSGYYGGGTNYNDSTDNSGTLQYVRVEYAGHLFSAENELNGIALQGVGSGTTIDHIQIHRNKDDGLEFFGGTANVKYIVLTGNEDDSLDCTDGWTGNVQFVVIKQYTNGGDHGFEMDNLEDDNNATPRSAPNISNATVIGCTGCDDALKLRRGLAGKFINILVEGYPTGEYGLDIDSDATFAQGTVNNNNTDSLYMHGSVISDAGSQFAVDDGADDVFNVATWFGNGTGNATTTTSQLTSTYVSNTTVGTAQDPTALGTFFSAGSFIGGVQAGNDWTATWTKSGSLTASSE